MILLSFFLAQAFAASTLDLKVESQISNYSLTITEKQFSFSSADKKIKRPISKCDRRAFDLYADKVKSTLNRDLTKARKPASQSMKAVLNKTDYYLLPLSESGVLLSKAEVEVDYLISEAVFRCSKK